MTRRTALALSALPSAAAQSVTSTPFWTITPERVAAHDAGVDNLIKLQTTDKSSPWRGAVPDRYGLHNAGTTCGFVQLLAVAETRKDSRHQGSAIARERLDLALDYLHRKITPDGNIDLLITNFNSPPDSAFAMYALAPAVHIARAAGRADLEKKIEPVLKRMAGGIARGGVHTPNHRWVMCAALAQAHRLYPNPAWLARVESWLAETIDIDADGQYSERSTAGYNAVVDRALTVTAVKLNKPQLLDPVRRNLESQMYLLHPGNEVVTDISKRQDQFTRGSMAGYWLAARTVAVRDANGQFESIARLAAPSLAELLEYPELSAAGPEPKPLPDNYEKQFPSIGIARIRRGDVSATVMMGGASRLFGLRKGQAVINAVRFSGAFFGKGQFVPAEAKRTKDGYVWRQEIDAGYYQPFGDGTRQPVGVDVWYEMRKGRRRTEVCRIQYEATLTETPEAFRFHLTAKGTNDLPVAIEINLAGEGELNGCSPALDVPDGFILPNGAEAIWKVGADTLRIAPGRAENQYTQVRGAETKLPGKCIYLTGYAPFEHTLEFKWT